MKISWPGSLVAMTLLCAMNSPVPAGIDLPENQAGKQDAHPNAQPGESGKKQDPSVELIEQARQIAQSMEQRMGHVIHFLNQDKLHGALIALEPTAFGLRWKHPAVTNMIHFNFDVLDRINLDEQSQVEAVRHASSIELTNGDFLMGDIVDLDGERLVLDTWYAGRMHIKRTMIKALNPNAQASSLVYEGPRNLENWTFNSRGNADSWTMKDDALLNLNQNSIGREIENMPDVASIEFEIAWVNYPSFYFCFYTDNLRSYNGNGYTLQVNGNTVYLQRRSMRNSSQLGRVNIEELQNADRKAHFKILVNRRKKNISLLINDKLVKHWVDTGVFAGRGNGIVFQPQSNGPIKITNLKIMSWDGSLPDLSKEQTKSDDDQDLILFINSDKVTGELKAVKDGKAVFQTDYAPLEIPIERITRLTMASTRMERARRNKYDVRATFSGKGIITFELHDIIYGMMQGQSENFGPVSLPMHACSLLEFNIYQERKSATDDDFF